VTAPVAASAAVPAPRASALRLSIMGQALLNARETNCDK
jgi:hypothetical protein